MADPGSTATTEQEEREVLLSEAPEGTGYQPAEGPLPV